MQTAWFAEVDPYASAVLKKHWPSVPNHGDVCAIGRGTVEPVDLLCGGFPCQPFSHAGKQRGADDDRHLWPQYFRIVDELRPAWVVGENVPGIVGMELDTVLSDLEGIGYAAQTFVIPAVAVDAPHRRDRVWIIARDARRLDANRDDGRQQQDEQICARRAPAPAVRDRDRDRDRESACAVDAEAQGLPGVVLDAISQRGCGRYAEREDAANAWQFAGSAGGRTWLAEPDVGRVANGVPSRVDRLRCLGNAIVPQIAEMIGRAIMACDDIAGAIEDE
jgi:DNA (cytosine-5)-methyltransferase 1